MDELESYVQHYFEISPDDCQSESGLFKPQLLGKGSYFLCAGNFCNQRSFIQSGIGYSKGLWNVPE